MFELSQIFIKTIFLKKFAHLNKELIWSAYPPHAYKENIRKSQEDLFLNLSYGSLKAQTITNFY